MTYYVAKRARDTRRLLAAGISLTLIFGLLCYLGVYLALPFLSAGIGLVQSLMLVAAATAIPGLFVNVLRGAAMGLQLWGVVALERVILSSLRVLAFGTLFLSGNLTLETAVLATAIPPIIVGLIYIRALVAAGRSPDSSVEDGPAQIRTVLSYASRVWIGSVASILLARTDQLLMAPLSSTRDLGLYAVAITVADLPLVIAMAVQGALFGVSSKRVDRQQVAAVSRITLLVTIALCLVEALTLPLWIGLLFSTEFVAATLPAQLLLLSAVLCIPALSAGTLLQALGRPELRSASLVVTLVANLALLWILVPIIGVYGACITSMVSNVIFSCVSLVFVWRVFGVKPTSFVLIHGADVRALWQSGFRVVRNLSPSKST